MSTDTRDELTLETFNIPRTLKSRVLDIASRFKRSKSSLYREAIEFMVRRYEASQPNTLEAQVGTSTKEQHDVVEARGSSSASGGSV